MKKKPTTSARKPEPQQAFVVHARPAAHRQTSPVPQAIAAFMDLRIKLMGGELYDTSVVMTEAERGGAAGTRVLALGETLLSQDREPGVRFRKSGLGRHVLAHVVQPVRSRLRLNRFRVSLDLLSSVSLAA